MSNQEKYILAAFDLAKTYKQATSSIHVLKNINLTVKPGEMVAIIGTSGSGKSTLLHLLAGLDRPTHGRIVIHGQDPHQLSERKKCELRNRYLGFVYQFHHLLPEFSSLENVGMPLLLRGEKPAEITDKAAQILEKVGLKNRLSHRLGQLSGGERQRVAIARALVSNPLCVLADEPTGNLDPHNAEKVLELFFELQKTYQTSVIMVTHDPAIANKAERILRIEEGTLV